jgi:hypothetical protein
MKKSTNKKIIVFNKIIKIEKKKKFFFLTLLKKMIFFNVTYIIKNPRYIIKIKYILILYNSFRIYSIYKFYTFI